MITTYNKMKKRISKEVPLSEITLRKYERPSNLSKRELIRKLCLSVGLLQAGDSRDVVVDILNSLMDAAKDKKELSSENIRKEVVKLRKKANLPLLGIADSNIRRQLKRLRDLFLVEKVANNYRINEFDDLDNIFEEKIERYYLENIKERVKEYFKALK